MRLINELLVSQEQVFDVLAGSDTSHALKLEACWGGNRLAYPHRTPVSSRCQTSVTVSLMSPCHVTSDTQSKCHTCHVRCT